MEAREVRAAEERGGGGFNAATELDFESVATGVREEEEAVEDPPKEGARGMGGFEEREDLRGVTTEEALDATEAREIVDDLEATEARLVVDILLATLIESLSFP